MYNLSSYACLVLMPMIAMATSNSNEIDKVLKGVSQGNYHTNDVKHGGVAMGVSNSQCDDAMWNIKIDWDDSTDVEYQCHGTKQSRDSAAIPSVEECLLPEDIPWPLHKCMNRKIVYPDLPPMAGPHRPLWPVYGEYLYIPPQRWIHSLEHGAVVFLYDPCADQDQIKIFKKLAKGCLRRHIITPYRHLADGMYFGVITYGCRLQMSSVDKMLIAKFVKTHALTAPEHHVTADGQYDKGLLHKALIITDVKDSVLCPRQIQRLLIAEMMDDV